MQKVPEERKTLARMVNQAKLRNNRNKPKYKFGIQVPRNHEEAMMIDAKNGDTRWKDSEDLELKQLFDYNSFQDLGKVQSFWKDTPR